MSLPTRTALGAAAVAAAVLCWLLLAPPLLGGRTTYVVTRGISMQPQFHTGDLVLLRRRPAYRVGQVVAYHSDDLDRTVMHRIIGFDGTRYRFKGDNNDFVDTSQPTQSELIGRYWVKVPEVGLAIAWASQPAHLPFVLGAALLLMLGGGAGEAVRRRRSAHTSGLMVPAQWVPPVEKEPLERAPASIVLPASIVAAALAAIAVSAGVIALSAAGKAETLRLTVPGAYTLTGAFSYRATVAPSAVYPSGRITTGDPVFVRIVPRVRFVFAYRFTSRFPHGIRGTGSFDAVISSPQGWRRTVPLVGRQPFSGDRGRLVATLDLRQLRHVVDEFQALTGISQAAYTVTLEPRLSIRGGVGGSVLDTSFAPTAPLAVDEFQLSVAQPQTLGDGPTPDPLSTSLAGSIERSVPSTIGLLVTRVSVRGARDVGALVAAAAALAALLAALVALFARRAVREDEDVQIEREFADWIVPIASGIAPGSNVIDVEDMESLVQIAEHYERMILRERVGDGFAYLVDEGGAIYRYASGRSDRVADAGKSHLTRFPQKGESTNPEAVDIDQAKNQRA